MINRENTAAALSAIPMELERIRNEFMAGLAQFQGTMRLDAARSLDAGGRAEASAGAARLVGWSVRAVGGAISVNVRNGRDVHGDIVAVIDLVDGASHSVWFGPGGISLPDGVYLERSGAGTVAGAVWIGAVD